MRDYYELTDEGRRRRLKPLAVEALEEYDLDVVRMRGLADATNGIFRLDTADGRRYAMRIGLGPPIGHTEEEMASEVAFLCTMAANPHVAVPEPIRRRDGDWYGYVSGDGVPHPRPVVIFTWLEGSLLADRVDRIGLRGFGETVAHLHDAGRRFEAPAGFTVPTFDRVYPYDLPFIVFSDAGDELLPPERLGVYRTGLEIVEAALARLASHEPPRVIHGDLHGWNVKVDHGRLSVFDFEDLLWGWPVQDLATALYYYWSSAEFDQRWAETRAGYETVAPWPDRGGEIEAFIIARTLLMANDVISQPEWRAVAPEIYERGERRIRDMVERIA